MRVAVSADWQFSTYERLSKIRPDGFTSRLVEFCEAFEWMANVATKHDCSALFVLGDLFDQRVAVPVPVLHKVGQLFDAASERFEDGVDVLVGNHDASLRDSSITSLHVLRGNARVWAKAGTRSIFGFVPWTEDVEQLSAQCAKCADDGAKYLFAHAMLAGAVPNAKGIDPAKLHPQRFKRVMLGDVHEPVSIKPNIQYAGAPLQINFGDAGRKRGVWILDTGTNALTFVENTESPKFWNVETLSGLSSVRAKDYVKVRVENYETAEQFIEAAVKKSVAFIESEAVKIEDAPPRLDIQSRHGVEDTLRRYCEHVGVNEPEKMVRIGMEILTAAKAGS